MIHVRNIILDANILIRAVLGDTVFRILDTHSNTSSFFTPEHCAEEARKHLPVIVAKRTDIDPHSVLTTLDELFDNLIQVMPVSTYADFEPEARKRIEQVDANDWPSVALALSMDCPIWTEDRDFFGTGIATWRTKNVELYLMMVP